MPPDADASPPSPRRFALNGPSVAVDPALNAFRSDVADIALAGQVIASHYAEPWVRKCSRRVGFTVEPGADGAYSLDVGDLFAVLDCGRGVAWGYRLADHRVGYVDADSLSPIDGS